MRNAAIKPEKRRYQESLVPENSLESVKPDDGKKRVSQNITFEIPN